MGDISSEFAAQANDKGVHCMSFYIYVSNLVYAKKNYIEGMKNQERCDAEKEIA